MSRRPPFGLACWRRTLRDPEASLGARALAFAGAAASALADCLDEERDRTEAGRALHRAERGYDWDHGERAARELAALGAP